MMSKRRAEDDENKAPRAKARKSIQATTAKQARNSADGRNSGKVVQVERFGASISAHVRQRGAGHIKRVKVTNFMCHSNMVVDFNEHVNFISGPNGSGKSAILQALQYCLGVRATQTGRAQTNAAYLKKGEEVCTAEVTLWNTGAEEDTFEPSLYGPTITIQKILSAKGSTTTKVLDHKGTKTGLSKADDVRRLLAKLSVNAANPSIVLTQDHARGLLTGNRVKNTLYDLLEESLDYKSTVTYLNMANIDIKEQRVEVAKHTAARKEAMATLDDVTKRFADAERAQLYSKLAEELEDHKAWAVVRHLRNKIAELDESLKDTPERQKQLQAAVEEKERELQELEAHSAQLGEMEQEMTRKVDECNAAREKLRLQKKEAMNTKNKLANSIRIRNEQIQNAELEKQEAEQLIAAVRARGDDQESIDKQMAEWHAAHIQATERLQLSQQSFQEQRKRTEDLGVTFTGALATHADAQHQRDSVKKKLQQATNELHSLQRSSGPHQEAMAFDAQAGVLLEEIRNNRQRFRKPVLGPIGACLQLEPSANKYSATICGALKNLLPAWIVDSREDQNTLLALAERVCRNEPKVIIMRYDLPPHKDNMRREQLPLDSITTIFQVLRIKPGLEYEHVVMNLLIDHAGIERVGLADNESAGRKILENPSLWQNLQKLLCNSAGGPVEMTRRGQNVNVWPWNFAAPEPLLSADKSEIVAARQRNVEAEAQRFQDAQNFEQQLREDLSAAKQAQRSAENELRSLQEQIKLAKQAEQQVVAQRPEVRSSADDELGEAIEQRENAQAEITRLNPELSDLKEKLEEEKMGVEEANQAMKIHQEERQQHQQQLEGQLTFMSKNHETKQKVQVQKDALLKKMEKNDSHKQEAEQSRAAFEATLAECVRDAESTCSEEQVEQERPALKEKLLQVEGDYVKRKFKDVDSLLDDKENLDSLARMIQQKGKKLEQRAGGSCENLKTEKETLEAKDGANRRQTGSFEALVKSQQDSLKARKDKFFEIRDSVDQNINKKFKDMLRTGRNWRGRIEVDHEAKEVTLSVTPHKGASTQGATACKDMKSLSGGERSFTCVSFVLSLGQEISTPFFAMDEFDVFMDAVNRKVALTSILKFAWELKGTQFILLSPLDMSVVEQSRADVNADFNAKANGCKVEEMPRDFVKCYAMHPPREGARAHF